MSSELENGGKDVIAILNRRVCYSCAFPIPDDHTETCPKCGGQDIDTRRARPEVLVDNEKVPELPFPWNRLKLKPGGTILFSGDAGSGKTTLCLKLRPTRYMSSEQELFEIKDAWWRVIGQNEPGARVPLMSMISSWEDLDSDLVDLNPEDLVVVDSISQLASHHEAPRIVASIIEKVRVSRARAVFIAQYTKDGDLFGPNMLKHLVDVLAEIPNDKTGLRRLSIYKNRFGSLFSQYFGLDGKGVINQAFEYGYTVEGPVGKYALHLYPTAGAKLDGIFKDFEEAGLTISGMASAAVRSQIYRNGYAEPQDVRFRREFAEEHGLQWIDPQTAVEMMIEHKQNLAEDG